MIPLNKPSYKRGQNITHSYLQLDNIIESRFIGYQYKILYSSRDGLNLIYKSLYEKYGSIRVAVSPLTCFSALYPIVMNGHTPVYVDIDIHTLNINDESLVNQQNIQALQLIYFGGNPANMSNILSWANEHNVILIEDCAQAFGSYYDGKALGTYGDYSVFSLVKNIYSYAGGLLLSKEVINANNYKIVSGLTINYKKIKRFLESKASYGNSLSNILYYLLMRAKGDSSVPSVQIKEFDVHYLSELIEQFYDIEYIECKRKSNASCLISAIDPKLYYIQAEVKKGESNRNRVVLISRNKPARELIHSLRKNGIACNNLTQSYLIEYQEHIAKDSILCKFYDKKLPMYESCFPYVITIPNSPFLSINELEYICKYINLVNKN